MSKDFIASEIILDWNRPEYLLRDSRRKIYVYKVAPETPDGF
jgi:hypothetical protein